MPAPQRQLKDLISIGPAMLKDFEQLGGGRRKIGLKNSRLARILTSFVNRNVIFCLTEFKSRLLSLYE